MDVKDLYYKMPQSLLLEVVRDRIDEAGAIGFQNSCGISATDFLSMLPFYLQSTIVKFEDEVYLQRDGVCSRSCPAPALSNLLLALFDRRLEEAIGKSGIVEVFRFVDDFLVVLKRERHAEVQVEQIFVVFASVLQAVTLTKEPPEDGLLRFLDLSLLSSEDHVCWRYEPPSQKGLRPFSSILVKRGMATTAMKSALLRSYAHQACASFHAQVERLTASGFPKKLLVSVAETLWDVGPKSQRKKRAVIPHVHCESSHRLNKVGNGASVRVVFSARNKLSGLCRRLNTEPSKAQTSSKKKKKHAFTEGNTAVVYDVPFSCGRSYIGQTGRRVNDRLREHASTLKARTESNLAVHCASCACSPFL